MDYLPISKVNTVVFCPRRYFIEVVLNEQIKNHHLIEGDALHERATREGAGLWVWSDRLGLIGVVDQLTQEGGEAVVTEFKKGALGEHHSDAAQLCALAMCVEEMRGQRLHYGYVFYHATRRKRRVDFSEALRAEVEAAVARMGELNVQRTLPPVTNNRSKCRGCSVRDACQPGLRRG